MDCEIRDEMGTTVVAVSGDVDLETSVRLRAALLERVGARRPVLVDMSAVTYIDSSGVASLVEAYQAAREGDTAFGLVEVSESAMRVLGLARLDTVFTIHANLDDGLKGAG